MSDTTSSQTEPAPIPMIIFCPRCSERHVDRGIFATKPHHTHSCQRCGFTWRPAVVATVGVQFLPGFQDAPLLEEREIEQIRDALWQHDQHRRPDDSFVIAPGSKTLSRAVVKLMRATASEIVDQDADVHGVWVCSGCGAEFRPTAAPPSDWRFDGENYEHECQRASWFDATFERDGGP